MDGGNVRMQQDEMVRSQSAILGIALLILLYAVISFGGIALAQEGRLDRYSPLIISHGALVLGWYVIVAAQASLAMRNKWSAHRLLGRLSFIHVLAMVAVSMMVTWAFVAEFGRRGTGLGDVLILATFLILYLAALVAAKRRAVDWHLRFMLAASLSMLSPAHARFLDFLGQARELTIVLVVLVYIAVPIAFDLYTRRRIHRASLVGMAVLLVMLAISVAAFVQLEGF